MELPRIPLDELETNPEDSHYDAVYQGRPFTGVAYDEWNGEYTETPYVDGTAHGYSFCRFAGGALAWEEHIQRGEVVEETAWWPPGEVVRHRKTGGLDQYFYRDGTLCREQTAAHMRSFYPSGDLKEEILYGEDGAALTYYGEDGEWAVKGQFPYVFRRSISLEREGLTFNEPYLLSHAADLLAEPAMDFLKYFVLWLPRWDQKPKRFSKPRELPPHMRRVICDLIRSDALRVKYKGINLAGTYRVQEAIPLLESSLSIRVPPQPYRSVESGGLTGVSYGHTIAQRAQIALEQLRRP